MKRLPKDLAWEEEERRRIAREDDRKPERKKKKKEEGQKARKKKKKTKGKKDGGGMGGRTHLSAITATESTLRPVKAIMGILKLTVQGGERSTMPSPPEEAAETVTARGRRR